MTTVTTADTAAKAAASGAAAKAATAGAATACKAAADAATVTAGAASFADPSQHSRWRALRLLQAAMDADIARIYTEARIDGLKPTWVAELLRLHANGPMTITELAVSVQHTHSAVSQKVAAMRSAGWVSTTTGRDARSKRITLTPKAISIVGRLAAEWRATEAAICEIEAEIPYPLSQVVTDIEEALRRKSFHDRIAENLAEDPAWAWV